MNNTESLGPLLDDGFVTAKKVNALLKKAIQEASLISPELIPNSAKSILKTAQEAQIIFEKFLAHEQSIKKLLGKNSPHHILILFQNKNEIRATGGFIGSLGFLELSSGRITDFSFRDVYDFDWQLKKFIPPPKELLPLTNRLHLRDANFSLDFPTSAKRIQWFLEHEKGPTVDTVIALDQSFLGLLLNITGPIEIPNTDGFLLSAENYDMAISYLVEGKFFGAGGKEVSPKQFLESLFPVLTQKLSESFSLSVLQESLDLALKKHLLAFSSDPQIEEFFDALGISGKIHPFKAKNEKDIPNGFAISGTSISTNKSDGYIQQDISHQTALNPDGSIIGELNITRTHNWGTEEEKIFQELLTHFGYSQYVGTDDLKRILGKGTNKIFMRILLPKGVEILSANGVFSEQFEQQETEDFTEVSFFFPETMQGETREIFFSYRLPEKFETGKTLNITFFSQPGMTRQTLEESITKDGKKSLLFSGPLQEDKSFIFLP